MKQFLSLYHELLKKYGAPEGQWGLWCKRPKTKRQREEVIIGVILTQNTNWGNVRKAIANLKRAKVCSLKLILELDLSKLEKLIRPSGFYKTKAKYLHGVAKYIVESGGVGRMMEFNYNIYQHHPLPPPRLRRGRYTAGGEYQLEELRNELLKLKGVGPETADSILLYGLDKPVFVIDEYTRRMVKARCLAKQFDYEYLRKLFEDSLPKKFELYQDFHALIVVEGKQAGRMVGK